MSEFELLKYIKTLITIEKLNGALTADHKQFLKKKEVIKRIKLIIEYDLISFMKFKKIF